MRIFTADGEGNKFDTFAVRYLFAFILKVR